jgi:hypothetical protein
VGRENDASFKLMTHYPIDRTASSTKFSPALFLAIRKPEVSHVWIDGQCALNRGS